MSPQTRRNAKTSHSFWPNRGLPVWIDVRNKRNPYQLAESVGYTNPLVKLSMPKNFSWDGASIPTWLPALFAQLLCLLVWWKPWGIWAAPLAIAYAVRLLPYMQVIGIHVRAACAHDMIYRTQPVGVSRAMADAIFLWLMEFDGVPWDARTIIYLNVRAFGGRSWRKNAEFIAASKRVEAAKRAAQPGGEPD